MFAGYLTLPIQETLYEITNNLSIAPLFLADVFPQSDDAQHKQAGG